MFKIPPIKSTLMAVSLALSAFSLNAQATLTSYTAGGKDVVYSSVSDVTWTKDANLLGTMIAANSNVIQSIVNASTNNYGSVSHTVTASDFNNLGQTNWYGANAFISYLNSISYAGSNQWRLPTVTDTGDPGTQFGFNGTDTGYSTYTNGTAAGNELTELYYQELGSKPYYDTTGNFQSGFGINNTATFNNEQADNYWSGTEYSLGATGAWIFGTNSGYQGYNIKDRLFYAWAVSPGQIAAVSAVPIPAAAWLFGSGVLGLVGLRRRRG